jgi:hypothetical protein
MVDVDNPKPDDPDDPWDPHKTKHELNLKPEQLVDPSQSV